MEEQNLCAVGVLKLFWGGFLKKPSSSRSPKPRWKNGKIWFCLFSEICIEDREVVQRGPARECNFSYSPPMHLQWP